MKTVIIGDIHGYDTWKKIVEVNPDADRFIFVGDYFDCYDKLTPDEQLENFIEICQFAQVRNSSGKDRVVLLIGNHDHHYWPGVYTTGTSGYQADMRDTYCEVISEWVDSFRICFLDEHKTIYSHAGISKTWLADNGIHFGHDVNDIVFVVNGLYRVKPHKFTFYHHDYSDCGDNVHQSPIWIRPASLYKDQLDYLQVVGHTHVQAINHPKDNKGFYLVDCLPRQYLICIDGKFTIGILDKQ